MRALVIATNWWDLGGRIAISLALAGFQVAELSPPGSILRKLRLVRSHYSYRPWSGPSSILSAIDEFKADFIVCADDEAVFALHRIHACMRNTCEQNTRSSAICDLIERSLGNPSSFRLIEARGRVMSIAEASGVRCPSTIFGEKSSSTGQDLGKLGYPIMVKADRSYGGRGIRTAQNAAEVRELKRRLAFSYSWPGAFAQIAYGLTIAPLADRILRRKRTITLQQFIDGRDANRAVVCLCGKVLAGISVEVLEARARNGPATLVKTIRHSEMEQTVERLVAELGLSGFCGFDFIIDNERRAWLLELNPRVTPTSALAIQGCATLSSTLFQALKSGCTSRMYEPEGKTPQKIALYRTLTKSKNLSDPQVCMYYDSWNEPEFLQSSSDSYQQNFLSSVLAKIVK